MQSTFMLASALLSKDENMDISEALKKAKDLTDRMEREILRQTTEEKDYFKDFKWPEGGATRSELDKWITESTGYTSNRKHEQIINISLAHEIIKKRLNTKRYYYNR